MVKELTRNSRCRICSSRHLEKFLSLGKTPLANSFLRKEDFSKEKKYPLQVYFCHNCYLVQLIDIVDKRILFSNYVYFYSFMPQASQYFLDYSKDVINKFIDNPKKELVVEFGSNDGLLLRMFQKNGCKKVLGIDPAKNIAEIANNNGVPTIANFFNFSLAVKISKQYNKAKVIIANNVVAHINDIQNVVGGVYQLLSNKGVFIFEAPYLMDMFENLAYDSIYHEHLSFLAVSPLRFLFKKFSMDIFDVQIVKRQGQSIRTFVCRSGSYPISSNVESLLKKENNMGLDKIKTYRILAKRIAESKKKLNTTLLQLKNNGAVIAAYGSPARGNTRLNYCGIGSDKLDFATEELPSKIGLYTPGTRIPIINIADARKNRPDYYLMLAWPYKDLILKKEVEFLKSGGKFIIPTGDDIEII